MHMHASYIDCVYGCNSHGVNGGVIVEEYPNRFICSLSLISSTNCTASLVNLCCNLQYERKILQAELLRKSELNVHN